MDRIFDRLGDMLRSILQDENQTKFKSGNDSSRFGDPDMQDAWDELNDFLNEKPHQKREPSGGSAYSGGSTAGRTASRPSGPPSELAKDYKALEVEFGASFETVKKAHKRLLVRNHPDKFAGNAEKQKIATELTQRLNQAFQRIKKYQETGKV